MVVSIGMLAWNEEEGIAAALESLFKQSAFSRSFAGYPPMEWEVIVVPNGCTDGTARVAREAMARCTARPGMDHVSCAVCVLEQSGKSNAWNHYVHHFSRKDASLIVMVDADIEFAHPDTLFNAVKALLDDPRADVAVDLPLKDLARKERVNILERISLNVSQAALEGPPGIAGSFYCARAEVLRKIWMPVGLSAEDGFLRAMIVTDLFRAEVDESRVIRAPDASHWFEAPINLIQVFRHELRLVIATAQNCYLTWDFLRFATVPDGPGAGHLIKSLYDKDSNWYPRLIENSVRNRGWWVLPRGMLFRRFSRLGDMPVGKRLKRIPLAVLSFLFDLPVFMAANRSLKKNGGIGYW